MCEFPAATLLKMKREVCDAADRSTNDTDVIHAANFSICVDNLRLAHEEMTGCLCWFDAVRNSGTTRRANAR